MLLISKNFVFPILRRKKNFAPENGGVGEGLAPPASLPPPQCLRPCCINSWLYLIKRQRTGL